MKIITTDTNKLNYDMYVCLRDNVDSGVLRGHYNWASEVKKILYDCGLYYIWEANEVQDSCSFILYASRILYDLSVNSIYRDCNASVKHASLLSYKVDFKLEMYLNTISNYKYRKALTQLRLSSHSLAIESGRHHRVSR